MTNIPTQRTPAEFLRDTIDALDVERFSLFDDESSIHFESDPDLYHGCSVALGNRSGNSHANQAALVLVELGVDGAPMHVVRVDRTGNYPGPNDDPARYADAFNYPLHQAGNVFILRDAITALQAVLDQLTAMHEANQ